MEKSRSKIGRYRSKITALLCPVLLLSVLAGPLHHSFADPTASPKAAFFSDEREVASTRLQLYDRAVDHLYANYYLHDGNKVGMIHFAALRNAARRMKALGKKPDVKLIIDGWGPEQWMDARVNPAVIKALNLEGIEVKIFNPVDLKKKTTYLKPNNFKRSHEKSVEIDGKYVILGDRNVQNINFRMQKTKGQKGRSYQSVETAVEDPSIAREVGNHFLNQFNNPLSISVDTSKVTPEELARAQQALDHYSNLMKTPSFDQLRSEVNLDERMIPVKSIQFIHDESGKDGHKIPGAGTEQAIQSLVRNSEGDIRITSPYFNPTDSWMKILDTAKKKDRPVRVQTVTEQATDAAVTVQALEAKMGALSKTGTEVLQFLGPDIAHAKIVEVGRKVDQQNVPVGERQSAIITHNLNARSANTDYESGLIIEGDRFAGEVRQFTNKLAENSRPFEKPKRNWVDCIKVGILNIVVKAPIVRDQI